MKDELPESQFNFLQVKGDVFGGLTAAIVTLPLALAFGLNSGLGPVSGLYCAIILGAIAVLVNEWRKVWEKEASANDLEDKLSDVELALYRANFEEDVVDAKLTLKERKAAILKKAEVLTETTKPDSVKKKTQKKSKKPDVKPGSTITK